jgi:tetratricopeptide (TPR) repeat protein
VNRLAALSAAATAALAIAACKKVEPVTAAPVPAPVAPGAMPPAAMPPPAMPPPGMPPPAVPQVGQQVPGAVEQRIAMTQQLVAQDPKNVKAWIALGNDYFDTHQPQKSIDAYANALALEPNNPDVLTDQGVMYRELGVPEKALANFLKANQVAPRHFQSLFNAGVVYAYDLKDSKKAVETWNKIIAADPSGPFATQSRAAIQALQQGAPAR